MRIDTTYAHPPRGQFFGAVPRAQSAIFARKEWLYHWLGPVARSRSGRLGRKSGGTALGSRQPPFRRNPIYTGQPIVRSADREGNRNRAVSSPWAFENVEGLPGTWRGGTPLPWPLSRLRMRRRAMVGTSCQLGARNSRTRAGQ